MRHAGYRRALAKRKRELAVDRRIDIGREPISASKTRKAFYHVLEPFVGHDRERAFAQGHHIMVEPLEGEAVEVVKVARDVEFVHRALAARKVLAARHPAVEQDEARG